jgi:hypothetical protein
MIKQVNCYIGPDQISEGFYTVDDGLITMVRPDGKLVHLDDHQPVQHQLQPGDNEQAIAKMLTRKIRKHFRGELVESFGNPINYPPASVA